MCGIFGYCFVNINRSRKRVLETLLKGLRRLEYRGYDSAGICFDSEQGVCVVKSVGKIDDLDAILTSTVPSDTLEQVRHTLLYCCLESIRHAISGQKYPMFALSGSVFSVSLPRHAVGILDSATARLVSWPRRFHCLARHCT